MVIDALATRWTRAGHRVLSHEGTRGVPDADVVVLHVDSTRIPARYRRLTRRYPVVVNGGAVDIAKSRYCTHLLTGPDDVEGPVMVKTVANYGGRPDDRHRRLRSGIWRLPRRLLGFGSSDWARRRRLDPLAYPIFESARDVPEGVWRNRHLMVQRFLPEVEDGLHFVRYWCFFGDRGWAARFGSRSPIAKFSTRVTPEQRVPVPHELVELRRCLALDYGRFDYVEHEGRPVVLDANKTLSAGRDPEAYADELDTLAPGIDAFLERAGDHHDGT